MTQLCAIMREFNGNLYSWGDQRLQLAMVSGSRAPFSGSFVDIAELLRRGPKAVWATGNRLIFGQWPSGAKKTEAMEMFFDLIEFPE